MTFTRRPLSERTRTISSFLTSFFLEWTIVSHRSQKDPQAHFLLAGEKSELTGHNVSFFSADAKSNTCPLESILPSAIQTVQLVFYQFVQISCSPIEKGTDSKEVNK